MRTLCPLAKRVYLEVKGRGTYLETNDSPENIFAGDVENMIEEHFHPEILDLLGSQRLVI